MSTQSYHEFGIFVYTEIDDETIGLGTGLLNDGNGFVNSIQVSGHVIIPSYINGKRMITLRMYSLRNCNLITKLTLPRTLKYLEDASLTLLSGIKEIIIPASIIELGNRIDALSSIKKVIFERGSRLEKIGDYFLQMSNEIKEIEIPSTVKSIGSYFLYNCLNIEHVIFCGIANFANLENSFSYCYNYKSAIVSKEYQGTSFGGREIEIKDFNN